MVPQSRVGNQGFYAVRILARQKSHLRGKMSSASRDGHKYMGGVERGKRDLSSKNCVQSQRRSDAMSGVSHADCLCRIATERGRCFVNQTTARANGNDR